MSQSETGTPACCRAFPAPQARGHPVPGVSEEALWVTHGLGALPVGTGLVLGCILGLHRNYDGVFRGGRRRGGITVVWGGTSVGKQQEKGRKGVGTVQRGTGQDAVSPDF